MKFIIDAHLPKLLSDFLNNEGYDSIHTLNLPEKNKTSDKSILTIAAAQNRVVVTKDHDFLDSYLLKREPEQLILVSTGNVSNKRLLELFEVNISKIVELLNQASLIEIYIDEIIIHSSY